MDDVINVTGHRLGTAEVEDALVSDVLFSIRVETNLSYRARHNEWQWVTVPLRERD